MLCRINIRGSVSQRSAHVKLHEKSNDRHAKVEEPVQKQKKRSQDVKDAESVSKHDGCIGGGTTGLGCPNSTAVPSQGSRLDTELWILCKSPCQLGFEVISVWGGVPRGPRSACISCLHTAEIWAGIGNGWYSSLEWVVGWAGE